MLDTAETSAGDRLAAALVAYARHMVEIGRGDEKPTNFDPAVMAELGFADVAAVL